MMTYNPAQAYSFVRGFNFQPDWSGNGVEVWLRFDANRYRKLIQNGKALFPGMNTLRIWLSFDAWCEDRDLYLKNIHTAANIIQEEGLRYIPVYLNGWFGIPAFGGFVPEVVTWSKRMNNYRNFRDFLRDSVPAVASEAVLLHDVSNEPFNASWGDRERTQAVLDMLAEMCREVRQLDRFPLTIGSQGVLADAGMGLPQIQSSFGDIDLLAPLVDAVTLHPYAIPPMTAAEHWDLLSAALERIKVLEKPAIVTECCWAGQKDNERLPFLELELPHYARLGLGFCVHALAASPVADLHPMDNGRGLGCLGLYMAFMEKDGALRPGHEIFNQV
jgi:hypothetical protein